MSSSSARSGAPTSRTRAKRPGPKSRKSDGSPKQRWTAAQRAERGRPPRRSAGRGHLPGTDRGDWTTTRPARSEDAGRRPARSERPERAERPQRVERPERVDQAQRAERPERGARVDRPLRRDRQDRPEPPRGERRRPDRARADQPRYDRSARTVRPDRKRDRGPAPAPVETDRMSWTGDLDDAPVAGTGTAIAADNGFARLGLPAGLVRALAASGITQPFPIQAATIGDALAGRDVLGRARTGSGKTLGFGLPMITRLAGTTAAAYTARGVVLVPTRELALQVADVLAPLARTHGLTTTLVTGGMSYTPQTKAFARGVDIVVATPGRLIDLLEQGAADLSRVEVTVLDEADHMADLGFLPAVTQILDAVPAGGQRLLFSATLDRAVDRLVRTYLVDPVTHEVDPGQASVATMAHHVLHVAPAEKTAITARLAGRPGRSIAFVRTQLGGDRIAEQLRQAGVLAGALHGGLTQGARARILAAFKDGRLPVLVATDVAARGIHVDDVGLVVQVDPPNGPKDYLHRAGRTARAGESGTVVTLVLPHQRREVRRLAEQAGVAAVTTAVAPGDDTLAELAGPATAHEPISRSAYDAIIAPPVRPARRRPTGDRPRRPARAR